MEPKDYYQVLGVAPEASADAIKRAYRRLARQYHPDVSQASDAAARMAAINEAHAVLSDPEQRAAYDAARLRGTAGPWRAAHDSDFAEVWHGFTRGNDSHAGLNEEAGDLGDMDAEVFGAFFDDLLGRMGAGQDAHGRGPRARRRGEDHKAQIELDLADAFNGGVHEVQLRTPRRDARGRVRWSTRTLQVRIPRGVRPGQTIRLAGQGGAHPSGGPAGDLLLKVRYRPHPHYRVEGTALIGELAVAPWEAALGAVVPVILPDGRTLKVRVPPHAQAGRHLRVRGKGLPGSAPGASPGDLELELKVLLPSAHDPRARRLYEAMARELPDFDARRVAAAERDDPSAA